MDRLLLINIWFVSTGPHNPLDYLAWLPIILRPVPLVASLVHFALVVYICIVVSHDHTAVNITLPIATALIAPLALPNNSNEDKDKT